MPSASAVGEVRSRPPAYEGEENTVDLVVDLVVDLAELIWEPVAD